ncbi:hypothetical protein Salat_2925900 [Sesamum alatum]|uniref:Uncharacterized protein n=1 Tax=Sesamum alatum TaxID=300844 RepID=A0AAE2C8C8_9LAMI|nr:hypothetical protein Salat_2925900 [Sesamum alatum]
MEEHQHQTEQKTSVNPASSPPTNNPDPRRDPPPSAATNGGATPDEDQHPGNRRDSKKRKGCPSALDKCEALIKKKNSLLLNSSCSFTFDTKFCGGSGFAGTPESTPKFGSFNSGSSTEIKREEKDGEDDEVKSEGEVELETRKGIVQSVD